MRNIRLLIEYDGTKYNGWQRLGNTENTIQHKLENVLSLMSEEKIEIIGSGRTDAGVHALGQVANFHTRSALNTREILDYCNQYLPQDIVVKRVQEAEERFHARYNATSKKYMYRIWNSNIPTAFYRKYSYHVPGPLSIEKMRKASSYFIGNHDFQAFSSMKSKKKSTEREIYAIEIIKERERIDIFFHGNGFLHNMVRIITGTLIEIGQGKRKAEEIPIILEGRIREKAGVTAPAQGLFLYEVYY
ncbi:tRNA pseudouridine(38-40) synthase TruA [Geosporobacter ferrireducens]|uniref:tRNA pseudouridine synthase A n=1 Tax=Geosporobacter ferrireducens TaxID=1424294 RepID=A0A1D8GIY8_9FIRM|nr:tRNA pseudouridine(38-40) synthase TruA [Geosporobacter ferrireducens]AOT70885.1 tRNA pseudouridine(38-40) synthase TruA [Geosporobacter ferrireducens]MTI53591.1 tRNA pseudouridine(38-40) synthase TruA [Geosporobacter ferrireducens]